MLIEEGIRMVSSKIKVVFFDAGGTLLRPAQSIGETYARLARNYGQNWDADLLQKGFKSAFKRLRPRPDAEVSTDGDERTWWKRVVLGTLDDVAVPDTFPFDDFFEELYRHYTRPDVWRVYPDVYLVLEKLRARGLKLAVLSNWDARLRSLINGLDLSVYFDAILISGELGAEKPSPTIYNAAVKQLGISPAQALMVGDDPLNDYWAPQKSGWHAVLVERPRNDLQVVLDWF